MNHSPESKLAVLGIYQDPDLADAMNGFLTFYGYEPTTLIHPSPLLPLEEVIQSGRFNYDRLVLDLLPSFWRRDYENLVKLREDYNLASIPTIILRNFRHNNLSEVHMPHQNISLLTKPFDPKRLDQLLKTPNS